MFNVSISKKDILALIECSATKDARYYLNGIHLHVGYDFNSGRPCGYMESTNGHILLRMCLDQPDLEVTDLDTSYDVILDIDDLKRFIRLPKKSEVNTCNFELTREGNSEKVIYNDHSAGYVQYPIRVIDGRYPDTTRVIKDWHNVKHKNPDDRRFRIQTKYLQTIAKITKYVVEGSPESSDPVIVCKDSGDFSVYWPSTTGVICIGKCLRISDADFDHCFESFPYWVNRDIMDESDNPEAVNG